MASVAKLKEQARAAESRDQWREAVVLYRQVVEGSAGEEGDITLWNRIGDLHLRLGETDRAVEAYEHAAGAYADSGLHNNAIALCRKILRLVPGRAQVYLKLGQISVASGFLADARQSFLEYAERMMRAGKPDAAFDALREFADLSPGDVEVRRVLADRLLANDRRDEAVEQLRVLSGALLEQGDAAGAEAIREQILALDPGADATPLVRASGARSAGPSGFADLHEAAIDPAGPAATEDAPEEAPHGAAEEGFELGSAIESDPAVLDEVQGDDGVAPLDGLEPTLLDEAPGSALEAEALDDEEPVADLPLLDLADESAADDLELIDAEEFEGSELPFLTETDGDEYAEGAPLPLLDVSDVSAEHGRAAPARDPLSELRDRVAAAPEDAFSRDELIRELRAAGRIDEVREVLEGAHRALAARGMYREAVAPITALIGLQPGDGLLLQKRVEYAFRSGDRDAQTEAYLDLARQLAREGNEVKARAVFGRVVELDPHNAEARAALQRMAPPPPPASPPALPTEDFVDLGSLILDEERTEPTTRFVVEEKEPTGDEDRDFADMLAHFRQKVAENIEAEDSSSHYDLGVAFMEMGLVDEAIAQFQVALRGGANPLATLELLGQCFVEKGQHAVAARVLDRALRLPGAGDSDLVGVLYLLGRTEEATGRTDAALEYYERVVAVDIRFRDTADRIEGLRAGRSA